jgi:hypothetical protein
LFFTVAVIVLLLTSLSTFAIAMALHVLGPETPEQLLREPRLLIPSMAAGYLIAGAILWAIFTLLRRAPPLLSALGWWRPFEPYRPVPVELPSSSQDAAHRRLLSHFSRRLDGRDLWHVPCSPLRRAGLSRIPVALAGLRVGLAARSEIPVKRGQ